MQSAPIDQVKDALGATTVLLVFVTVLFNAKYPEIRARAKSTRPETPTAVRQWKQDLWDCLIFHVGPVLVVAGGAAVIFLPVVKTIVTERPRGYWDNLDFGATTFLFVFVVVTGLALWAGWRAWQLWRKYRAAVGFLARNR
jgi:hypothetical protein